MLHQKSLSALFHAPLHFFLRGGGGLVKKNVKGRGRWKHFVLTSWLLEANINLLFSSLFTVKIHVPVDRRTNTTTSVNNYMIFLKGGGGAFLVSH